MNTPLLIVMLLFLLNGFTTVLNSLLNPYFQGKLQLSYREVVLIQVVFYVACFIVSPIAGYFFRHKYVSGIRLGAFLGVVGMFLMSYASIENHFSFILFTLFIQGTAIALIQVTGNPYVFSLGDPNSASSRLLFVQGFTALGMCLAPYLGSVWILSRVENTASALPMPYIAQGLLWGVLALLVIVVTMPKIAGGPTTEKKVHPLKDRFVLLGMFGITLAVGIETGVASFLIKYLADPEITGFSLEKAGKLSGLFWIGFMLSRFIGAFFVRFISKERFLYFHGFVGMAMCLFILFGKGKLAAFSVLFLGACTSNLFPLIYSIVFSCTRSCKTEASGYLTMANIGGALVPFIQSIVADSTTIKTSFVVPLVGFLALIAVFQYVLQQSVFQKRAGRGAIG